MELRPQYGLVRITGGNFRLVDRLLTQVRRLQTLNHLDTLTPEIVDTARETLLIGH
jgi:hypothetical protein